MKDALRLGAIVAVALIAIVGNTCWHDPPRFDGAGYSVLARALAEGRGYREISHPDAPRHGHFPPGYPLALASLWRLIGPSVPAAHALSVCCTLAAVVAAWCWFRALYPPRVAFPLGLALAANWTWGRVGGAIQSEPLYLLLGQCAILVASWWSRPDDRASTGRCAALGVLLACCTLTRQVGVCLIAAVVIDLLLRRRRAAAAITATTAFLVMAPWALWLLTVPSHTQVGLLSRAGLGQRIAVQALFYVQRLPDLWTGPFVETATVFRRSGWLAAALTVWAAAATAVVAFGWARTLRGPRRRLAGLIAATTFPLLLVWPFTEAGRFLIPLAPCVLVGLVEGLAPALRLCSRRNARVWAAGLVLATSIPYAAYAIITRRAEARAAAFADFDAACAWIRDHSGPAGPILSRHPGEVFWLTGRQGVNANGGTSEGIEALIWRYGIAYLLVDEERYANAPASTLARFAAARPERVRRVWSRASGNSSITIEQVVPEQDAVP